MPDALVKLWGDRMVFARLKQETHDHHTRLENTVDILNRTRTVTDYQRVLETFYGFYKPIEDVLGAVEGIGTVSFHERRKVTLLANDLRSFGLSDLDIDHLLVCADLPPLTTLAEAFGCLYVLEGATLGGQIISRQLRKLPPPPLPDTFFMSYGPDVGSQWRALQAVVEQLAHDEPAHNAIIASAQATFTSFDQWFQQQHPRKDS